MSLNSHLIWFRQYLLKQRLRTTALSWSGCSLLLALLQWIHPGSYNLWIMAGISLFFLIISYLWAWWQVNVDYCLNSFRNRYPSLSEQLRTQLELDSHTESSFLWKGRGETVRVGSFICFRGARNDLAVLENSTESPFAVYFRKRHLAELIEKLEQVSPKNPGWISAICVAVLIQGLLMGSVWLTAGSLINVLPREGPYLPPAESIRMLFPSYLKRTPETYETLPLSIFTPRGSRLEMTWKTSLQAEGNITPHLSKEDSFFKSPEGKLPLQWIQQEKLTIASLTPEHSGTLKLGWESRIISWQVIEDKAPILQVTWPDMKHIFDTTLLSIEVFTEDDNALHQVLLHYQIEKTEKNYREILQSYEEDFRVFNENYQWDLSITPLQAGDQVSAWIEARDWNTLYGPNISKSPLFQFKVESLHDYHEGILKRFDTLSTDMRDLIESLDLKRLTETYTKEKKMMEELKKLHSDVIHDSLLSVALKAFPKELEGQLNYFHRQRELLLKME